MPFAATFPIIGQPTYTDSIKSPHAAECYLFIRYIHQNISRLAVEGLANGFECAETNGLGFTGFEYRQVGQCQTHFF